MATDLPSPLLLTLSFLVPTESLMSSGMMCSHDLHCEGHRQDPFLRCVCHNTPLEQEIIPCDRPELVSPGVESTSFLRCGLCWRCYCPADLLLVSRVRLGGII